MSINSGRWTRENLLRNPLFTLCPAVEGLEPLLLAVGGCSGRHGGKSVLEGMLEPFGALCEDAPPAVVAAPARLACRVVGELSHGEGVTVGGHALLLCQVVAAAVAPSAWEGGKLFVAPLLTFLGSSTFGVVRRGYKGEPPVRKRAREYAAPALVPA